MSAKFLGKIVIADLRRLCLPPRRGKEKIAPNFRSLTDAGSRRFRRFAGGTGWRENIRKPVKGGSGIGCFRRGS